ncbi:hypothetical protein [Bradyrhizobium sp. USDA 4502]
MDTELADGRRVFAPAGSIPAAVMQRLAARETASRSSFRLA